MSSNAKYITVEQYNYSIKQRKYLLKRLALSDKYMHLHLQSLKSSKQAVYNEGYSDEQFKILNDLFAVETEIRDMLKIIFHTTKKDN